MYLAHVRFISGVTPIAPYYIHRYLPNAPCIPPFVFLLVSYFYPADLWWDCLLLGLQLADQIIDNLLRYA